MNSPLLEVTRQPNILTSFEVYVIWTGHIWIQTHPRSHSSAPLLDFLLSIEGTTVPLVAQLKSWEYSRPLSPSCPTLAFIHLLLCVSLAISPIQILILIALLLYNLSLHYIMVFEDVNSWFTDFHIFFRAFHNKSAQFINSST